MADALRDDGMERRTAKHPHGVRRDEAQMDFAFAKPVLATPTKTIRGMVRGDGRFETQRAAVDVAPHRTKLQTAILHALAADGPLTDRELELRAEFRGWGPSTVRKRRSELFQQGVLVDCGRRDKLTLWAIAPVTPADRARHHAP